MWLESFVGNPETTGQNKSGNHSGACASAIGKTPEKLLEAVVDEACFLRSTTRQHRLPPLHVLSSGNLTPPPREVPARFVENRVSRATPFGYVRKVMKRYVSSLNIYLVFPHSTRAHYDRPVI